MCDGLRRHVGMHKVRSNILKNFRLFSVFFDNFLPKPNPNLIDSKNVSDIKILTAVSHVLRVKVDNLTKVVHRQYFHHVPCKPMKRTACRLLNKLITTFALTKKYHPQCTVIHLEFQNNLTLPQAFFVS